MIHNTLQTLLLLVLDSCSEANENIQDKLNTLKAIIQEFKSNQSTYSKRTGRNLNGYSADNDRNDPIRAAIRELRQRVHEKHKANKLKGLQQNRKHQSKSWNEETIE